MSTYRTNRTHPLTRRKRAADCPAYTIVTPDGTVVADVARTGQPGRDTYPWDFSIEPEWCADSLRRATGTAATLTEAVDVIRARLSEDVWGPQPAQHPTSRSYCVGLPVVITVDDSGTVTYQVCTEEAGEAVREGLAEGLIEYGSTADADVIDADHDRRMKEETHSEEAP